MKKGVKIFIVVIAALATNFALHAAFWGAHRNGHCGPNGPNEYNQCGPNHQNHWGNHHGNTASPWGCGGNHSYSATDTLK